MMKFKKIILKNKKWIILSIFIIVFVVIAQMVVTKERFDFDSKIYLFLVEHRTNFLNTFFKIITQLGGAICCITICILCIIFFKNRKYKYIIPINLITIACINIILKNIFDRPRPSQYRLIEQSGFSFPSGHSMASMAFYGYFIYLSYKYIKNKKIRYSLCTILTILILLIGISRIYLGVHYASDVIAGLCFSMAYLILMISIGLYR